MRIASNIVRVSCDYIRATVRELELAVEAESWGEAHEQALLVQRQIQKHRKAIQKALWRRLSATDEPGTPEFGAWLIETKHLLQAADELAVAVHDRDQTATKALLARMTLFLALGVHETVDVVSQVEALTGDLSQDLGAALQEVRVDGIL